MARLPPPPVPRRPDLAIPEAAPRRRFPRWVTAVCLILAVSLAAVAVAPLLGGREREGAGYLFLDRTDQGDPTRWNPCAPIRYVINARLAPPGSIEDVHTAVAMISEATGIAFEYEGTTTEPASAIRDVYQPDRYGERWVPVLIAWADPDTSNVPFERDDEVAAGIAVPVIPPTRVEDVYVSGWIALNAEDPNPPGFAFPGAQGPVILHELGHLMGLGHVDDPGEIMHPSGGGITELGPGDREGLRRVGASGGCVRVLEPIG